MTSPALLPRPFVVVWRVLDRCNLACPFCAYDKRLTFPRKTIESDEVRRVIALLGEKQGRSGRPHLVSWLGGEPTLWKDLPEMATLAETNGLMQSLTTNGTTLGSPRIRALFVEKFHDITISVDGFAEVHDGLRGWPGAFEKLRKGMERLRTERDNNGSALKLRANVVLMRRNLGRFAELCRELADWGIEEITFNQLGGRDRPEFHPMNRLRREDVARLWALLPDLRAELAGRGTTLLGGEPYVQRIADCAQDLSLPITSCRVAQDFWFIDEQGTIAPCNFVEGDFGLNIRDLRDVEAFEALSDRLCNIQRRTPSAACANRMSTQQAAKFAV